MKEDTSFSHLVDYLDRNIKKGYSLESLKWALINQKHSKTEVEKAIKIVQARSPPAKREMPKDEQIQILRDEILMPRKKGFWARLFSRD